MLNIRLSKLNPSQRSLIRSRTPTLLVAGGYGSGKSKGLQYKGIALKSINGTLPGLVIGQNYGALNRNIIAPLLRMLRARLDPKLVPRIVGWRSSEPKLIWADGTIWYLGSAENPASYDGVNVAYVLGDEIRHWNHKAFQIAQSRARIKEAPLVQRVYASTPAVGWMSDEFNTGVAGRELITAPTSENAHNLTPTYIEDIRASYSKRLQRAILEGIFTILEGAVFDDFDPQPNSPWIVDFKPTPDVLARKIVHMAIDPGFRRSSYLFIALDNPNSEEGIVFDQMQLDGVSDMAAVEMVNARKYPIDEIWIDPAADATQSVAAIDTLAAIRGIKGRMRNNRLIRAITTPFNDIRFGIDKMRVLLGGYAHIKPRIKFSRDLLIGEIGKPRGIIKDLCSSAYPEKEGRAISDDPIKDGMVDHCLCGNEEVFIVGHGWTRLDNSSSNGLSNLSILTPEGVVDGCGIAKTRTQESIFEVVTESGSIVVATGDHRLLVGQPDSYKRDSASVSWKTVLQMREILFEGDRKKQERVSACCRVCRLRWDCKEWNAVPPPGWEQIQQQQGKHCLDERKRSPESTREDIHTKEKGEFGQNKTNDEEMARIGRGDILAHCSRSKCVGWSETEGIYLPIMREAVSIASNAGGKILQHELQADFLRSTARCSSMERVVRISAIGKEDVYCASVPKVESFILRSGFISHNSRDALRMWTVGRWLTCPSLRARDVFIQAQKTQGYRDA